MAVIYNPTVRTARMDVVLAAIDQDAGPGFLVIGTAGMAADLVAIELADPAGAVAGDVLTFTMPRAGVATGTGTAAAAEIRDNSGDVIVSGLTVGLAATNVVLDSVSITTGQNVTINSGTLTHNTTGV